MKLISKFKNIIPIFLATYSLAWADTLSVEPYVANISVNALTFLFRQTSVSADFGVSPSLVIGPHFSFFRATSENPFSVSKRFNPTTLYIVGADATYFFNQFRFSNSWFANLGLSYAKLGNNRLNADGILTSFIAGYGWYWGSGINLSLGLGATVCAINDTVFPGTTTSESSLTFGIIPSGKVQVGYAF